MICHSSKYIRLYFGCKGNAKWWKRDKTNDESSGTFVEKCRKSPISGLFRHHLSIFGRQYAKFLLKTLGEIAGRAEARSLGNFIHTLLTFLKQGCCTMKADAADKCHRSSIGQSRQLFIKSCPLHTEILCQLFHAIFAIFQDAALSEHAPEESARAPD